MEKIFLSHTSSTMQAMEELLKQASKEEGSIVWTDYQSAGKGQDGNHWESESGLNLLLTSVYYPTFLDPARQFLLSKMASLAVHGLVSATLPTSRVYIKWPNDLYIEDQKVAGILIRHSLKGNQLQRCLIGIGLNVNQTSFSPSLINPVSLKMLSGKVLSREALLDALLKRMNHLYAALKAGTFTSFEQQYRAALYRLDTKSKYHISGEEVAGVIRGVDELGSLLLESRGELKAYGMKEVVYLPVDADKD